MAPPDGDPRTAAFCCPDGPDVFHAVAHRQEIWKEDPFDVGRIHDAARAAYQRLVHRATTPPGLPCGRILLLLGEAGSGKTHLMRGFRNWAHARGRGFCGYMQMTSSTGDYGRYVLNNLIDSLDQPYYEPEAPTSGLMRLANALAETAQGVPRARLDQLREDELDPGCLAKLIDALADQVVMDDRYNDVDLDLVRALLYLQRNDPRIKGRVLKYLRCEDLSGSDRLVLGGIVPRRYDDAPRRVVALLGKMVWAVASAALVLCVDQLEDIYNLDDARVRFRRAMATVCDLADRIPSSIVVISCLEDFYATLREHLTQPLRDRIEKDPAPIRLQSPREADEVVDLVAYRLRFLYESLGVPSREDDATFPIPQDELRQLAGQRTRDILGHCQAYREACCAAGTLIRPFVGSPGTGPEPPAPPPPPQVIPLEQEWNDFRTAFPAVIPAEDDALAAILARAIAAWSDESPAGRRLSAEPRGRMVLVEGHDPGGAVDSLLVGVCNKSAQGGGLGRQIAEVADRARGHSPRLTPVVVRSTDFPSNPRTDVVKQLGAFLAAGGRRAVIEDAEWRTMLALDAFREQHRTQPAFLQWLRQERPLGRLKALQAILALDDLKAPRPGLGHHDPATADRQDDPAPQPQVTTPSAAADQMGLLIIGTAGERAETPVTIDPAELTRPAVFLGEAGSGPTTAALGLVEQLLLRGVPALLIDRKGDLCGYARGVTGSQAPSDAAPAAPGERLRLSVDVAVYTPGHPGGRPLSIAIVPGRLSQLPSFEREQVARYAASALGGMMNYSPKGGDQARLAILANAINLLSQCGPDATVTLDDLIRFITAADPSLINAVGRLDPRDFGTLVQDLETLRLTRGDLLAAPGERLDAEALLGLGPHATPGRTRLSVISTQFLGGNPDVQFWMTQWLVEMGRWASRSPSAVLQAVLLIDEADLDLPAPRQPPTKEPMEELLRRARSAGLGLLLTSQRPGDFDYTCRDCIGTWFVGRIKEETALRKMKPMLGDCRVDIAARLPTQETGQFHLIRAGEVTVLRAAVPDVPPAPLPEEQILALARRSQPSRPSTG